MSFTPSPLKDQHMAKCWQVAKAAKPEDRQGLPSKTWAQMDVRTRSVLVMLGAHSMEDPREVARRPWGSLSDSDRQGIASVARELGRDLKNASCLF